MRTTSNILSHFLDLRKKRRTTAAVLTALSLVVAAGVFWQLRLTGISMTADPQCGYEVHTHGEGCSQVSVLNCSAGALGIHTHDGACRNEAGDLICGKLDMLLHTHDSRCRDAAGALVCTLPEAAPHQHGDGCYTPTKVVVDPGHQHGEACYSYIKSELTTCGQEEVQGHTHTDTCVTAEIYSCGQEESDTHTHSADCGIQIGCGIQETPGHAHTDDCYPAVQNELICQEEVREPVTGEGEPELTCTSQVLQLHEHSDGCYTDGSLTCGLMELKSHQHTDACFRLETREGLCRIPEHTHTDACYPDLKADVETAEDWEKDLPELQEDRWADNLIAVAQSQLGYAQSQRNFMAGKPGQPNHYTRYGQWAGEPYGDWRGQYISFCLHYAGIPPEAIPYGADVADWAKALREFMILPRDAAPQLGDVIFFDSDGDETADAVGILAQALPKETEEPQEEVPELVTLQGNVAGQVAEAEYDSEQVLSFLSLADARVRYEQWLAEHPETTEPAETTEAAEPAGETTASTEEATESTGETTEPTADATEPTEFLVIPEPRTFTKVHEGDDYTITATYSDETGLPENAELKVVELLPGSKEYEDYYAQVKLVLGADNLVYTRLFDVTFLVDGQEVEPCAGVNISIQYHEALVPNTDKDTTAQVVHFAESGTEVLPAEVQKDDRGITEISHVQDSFSIVAYTLLTENTDNGNEALLVDWYVFLDKKWTKVGSTRTGQKVTHQGNTYDIITGQQAMTILGPYGFAGGADKDTELAYRKIASYGENPVMESGIWSVEGALDGDQQTYYRLSYGSTKKSYCIYFLPNNETIIGYDDEVSENSLNTSLKDIINVYSVRVYDPDNEDYGLEEDRPVHYVPHGGTVSITVRKGAVDSVSQEPDDTGGTEGTEGEGKEDPIVREKSKNPWAVFTTRMDYLGALTENENAVKPGDLGSLMSIKADEKHQTITVTQVTQPLHLARASHKTTTVVDTSQAPDDLTVNYYVYLEGEWQLVGATYTGWTIDGRLAANKTDATKMPYLDPYRREADGGKGYYINDMYARDVVSMNQVVEVLGKYGFAPEVAADESSALRDKDGNLIPDRTPVRIANLGYRTLKANGDAEERNALTIYFDSNYDFNQNLLFPLGQSISAANAGANKTPQGGYNVYYVPGGVAEDLKNDNMGTYDSRLKVDVNRKPINYYVYVDEAWTRVGTTQYLTPGSGTEPDRISVEQMRQVFAPYGFETGDKLPKASELFCQNVGGTISNTHSYSSDKIWYQLSDSIKGYNIYWLPGNTEEYSSIDEIPITENNIGGTFHLLTVFEESRSIYESLDAMPRKYIRHGAEASIIVKKPPDPKKNDWILKGLDRNEVLATVDDLTSNTGNYGRTDNGNGTYTFTIQSMTETVIVAFPYANGDRSLSNNYANAENADALGVTISDPNITFTMHNYSTRINELLVKKGLAVGKIVEDAATGKQTWENGDAEKTVFAFKGAGGVAAPSSSSVDADEFMTGHSSMKRNLSGGYPQLAANGTDMGFLWGSEESGTDKNKTPYIINYTDVVNTPLQVVNGQYRYYSYFNAADFNTAEQKFYLRPYAERTEETALKHLTYDAYSDFLPFNHSGGDLISDRPYNFYQEDVDYWYGMTMRTRFFMTEDGTVNNGDQMIFGFSGGDDTYVYIDDMLILDMGGTHGAVTGTINFHTGLVQTYYDFDGISALPAERGGPDSDHLNRYQSWSLYELCQKALEEKWGSDPAKVNAELSELFETVTIKNDDGSSQEVRRFKPYSTHRLDMFYLDRNSATANFNLSFNMPTLPDAALTVSLDTNFGDEKPTDDDYNFYSNAASYQFRIVDKDGNPLHDSLNAFYDVRNQDGSYGGRAYATVNGIFRIKSGQRAVVKNITDWVKRDKLDSYWVQELIPVQDVHTGMQVKVDGQEVLRGDRVQIGDAEYYAYSREVVVEKENPQPVFIPFTNTRSLQDYGYLRISTRLKIVTTCHELFRIKVSINGQLVPEGTRFYLVDGSGNVTSEYIRANDKGEIRTSEGKTYQLGAKLLNGYTYSVVQQETPEGWAVDKYFKEVTAGLIAPAAAVDIPAPGPATGTIATGKTDTITVQIKQGAYSASISLSTQFKGLDTGDQVQRTAVYEITQVQREDCPCDEETSDFYEWDPEKHGTPTPEDLKLYNRLEVTATGSKAEPAEFRIPYPASVAEGAFYYEVKQTDLINFPYGESFITDQNRYYVKVTVGKFGETTGAVVSAIYSQAGKLIYGSDCDIDWVKGPSTLYFYNTRVGYRLPESGGPGVTAYIFSGIGCMGLALLMYKCDPLRKLSRTSPTRGQRKRHHRPRR